MPTFRPKTGVVQIAELILHICHTINRYGPKIDAFITTAQTAGAITLEDATTARACLLAIVGACTIFQTIANYYSSH